MYDKGMHGMFGNVRKGMYDFAAAGSGRDRVRPRWAWPEVPTARADSLPIHTIRNRQFVDGTTPTHVRISPRPHTPGDPCTMFANSSKCHNFKHTAYSGRPHCIHFNLPT
jgi:hypothetical protein